MKDLVDGFEEALCGELGHEDTSASALHACRILFGAEDTYLTVLPTEGLQSFEGLLTVVEAGSSHRDGDHIGRGYFPLAPLAIAVVALQIVVGGMVAEPEALPVQLLFAFHCLSNVFIG